MSMEPPDPAVDRNSVPVRCRHTALLPRLISRETDGQGYHEVEEWECGNCHRVLLEIRE